MTKFSTADAQFTQVMGVTGNTVGKSTEEVIEAKELKYRTEVFITELVAKASDFQDMSKRTDMYLYELLQDCYEVFVVIDKESSNIASTAQAVLDKYCTKHGITKGKSTKLLSKFMNCVFKGADRSKISTYSYVIKYAVTNQIASGQLANEIKKAGGIQKIKEASFIDVTAKTKATLENNLQLAQTKVSQSSMGVVEIPIAMGAVSNLNTGDQVVLVATINADRKFVIRAATNDARVIKSAVLATTKPKKVATKKKAEDGTDDAPITSDERALELA